MKTLMKPLTYLLSPRYLLAWLFSISLLTTTHAADLTITPTNPMVAVNQQITLAVSGTSGEVIFWEAAKGQIQGTGNQVTYIAPGEVVSDAVKVMDSAGNRGILKITITQTGSLTGTNWQVISNDDSSVQALALSEDGKTLWVGNILRDGGGLEQREATTGKLISTFLTENSGLPHDGINILLSDGIGGLWIGTGGGLAHLGADNTWQVFNTENSGLPHNSIFSLLADGSGGLWVGTAKGGLAHYHADGQWEVFNTTNPGLPDDSVYALVPDGAGGLWIGTQKSGLVHRTVNGEWIISNTANSGLPDNGIWTALEGKNGGVWLGTFHGGLAHLSVNNEWTIFNTKNSDLPSDLFLSLADDGNGGVWIGTEGLAHLDNTNGLTNFDPTSAGLPNKGISALVSDNKGGVWLGVTGGIAHVTPVKSVPEVVTGNRAAIIIAGGGADATNSLWDATESISNRLYSTFSRRGFNNAEIYYLSPKSWEDFNGDGYNDRIVDAPNPERPLTVEDVRAAFEWAKTRGSLDEPLYLFFTDHGGPQKLQLGRLVYLEASELKAMLDDYQNATDNAVIVVIDASYSGSFLPVLAAPNRAIISSTDAEEHAYFAEKQGFNRFFAEYLSVGASFFEAFEMASRDQNKMLGGIQLAGSIENIHQTPQLDDGCDGNWLKQGYIGGNFVTASLTTNIGLVNGSSRGRRGNTCGSGLNFTIQELTPSTTLQAGQPFVFKAQVKLTLGTVKRVWATLEPPSDNFALKTKSLELSATSDPNVWETTWNEAYYNGEYKVTFQAESNSGNTTSSNQIVITVTGGLNPPQERIAIIIAGGGSESSNSIWKQTESNANFIYKTLYDRGFRHEDIFYLSPKTVADFDGNGQDDDVIDTPAPGGRPLTDKDLIAAFEWAKTRGKLGQPLYLFFLDHGDHEKIALSKETSLGASQFKEMLDDYQKVTGNAVIVVIEACYSGSFIRPLVAPNRAVITSASESEEAFFPDDRSFISILAKYLSSGNNFNEAFGLARGEYSKIFARASILRVSRTGELQPVFQTPQLDDNGDGQPNDKSDGQWLSQFQINVKSAGSTFYVKQIYPKTTITIEANQSITFKAMAGDIADREAKAVWAIIRPSKLHFTLDGNGTPFLILPRLDLKRTAEPLTWEATWNAVYNDNYEVSFYAEENDGNITSSDENIIVTVTGGIDPPAQASVQISLTKNQYQRGEHFTATVTENLGWGYDLYVAVTLPPDGSQYMTLTYQNEFAPLSHWLSGRTQSQPITVLDLDLPNDLPTGQYCLWAILSPEKEDVFATLSNGLWVVDTKCFGVF